MIGGVGLKLLILNQKRVKVLIKYIEIIPVVLKEIFNLLNKLTSKLENKEGITVIEIDENTANKLRAMLTSIIILSEFNDNIFEEEHLPPDSTTYDYSNLIIPIISKSKKKFKEKKY